MVDINANDERNDDEDNDDARIVRQMPGPMMMSGRRNADALDWPMPVMKTNAK